MPTTVVVDANGVIRWIDVHPNYTTRSEVPDILVAVHRWEFNRLAGQNGSVFQRLGVLRQRDGHPAAARDDLDTVIFSECGELNGLHGRELRCAAG